MKKNKKKITGFIILGILISARIFIHFQPRPVIDAIPGTMKMISVNEPPVSPDRHALKTIAPLSTQCREIQMRFSNIAEVKKIESASTRFVNTHKKIDGVIYRFRLFFKETSENEVPQYLLYREDEQEEDHLIEVSPYNKGSKYLKFEKKNGETIYSEEGLNIGLDQNLFLHFENEQLKKIQGTDSNKLYDCAY